MLDVALLENHARVASREDKLLMICVLLKNVMRNKSRQRYWLRSVKQSSG